MTEILSIARPQTPIPLIFDSPHSGTHYPADFDYACAFAALEQAEDKYVDDIFACAPAYGASLLCALFPRSYIDVNRAVCDVDPNLLEGDWPFGAINPTSRSDAGIGLIRRLVKPGTPVYSRHLTAAEITARIETCYHPYHEALKALIDEAHYNFGQSWHINCHSMPASSAYPKQAIGLVGHKGKPADFVLGDRDGTSCAHDFTYDLRDFLKKRGYTVTINDPFKGVELVSRHSDPARFRHSLQIEINKSLYMDEDTGEKSGNYSILKADIEKLISFCASYVSAQLTALAAD